MIVLMIGRATLFSHPGGDTIQLCKTAEYLNKIKGLEVEIKTVAEDVDFNRYDLLHLFNLARPADHLGTLKKTDKPFVISTVFVDYSEAEKHHFSWKRRLLKKIFSIDQLEYIKAVGRFLKGQDKLTDASYLIQGHRRAVKKVLKASKMLLPNSENEYRRLVAAYGEQHPHVVIPNAIDLEIFDPQAIDKDFKWDKFNDSIVTVGQLTPVKNHLNLIKALNEINCKAFIIGSPSSNADAYYAKCKELAGDHIEFISHLDQKELAQVYHRASVHVLASWFETTGLVSLEAAYCGCNIVVTDRGDQKEYFEGIAYFCEPDLPDSIQKSIEQALEEPFRKEIRDHISLNHNWELTAQKTYFAYRKVMGYTQV